MKNLKINKFLLLALAGSIGVASAAHAATINLQQEQDNSFNLVKQVPATLVSGVDAPMPGAQPGAPVLVSFDQANGAKCTATGSAVGDLASERVKVAVRQLSCVYPNGATVTSTVDAFAIGKDGYANIPGEVKIKQGAILAKTIAALPVDDLYKGDAIKEYALNGNGAYPIVEVLPNQEITLVFRAQRITKALRQIDALASHPVTGADLANKLIYSVQPSLNQALNYQGSSSVQVDRHNDRY